MCLVLCFGLAPGVLGCLRVVSCTRICEVVKISACFWSVLWCCVAVGLGLWVRLVVGWVSITEAAKICAVFLPGCWIFTSFRAEVTSFFACFVLWLLVLVLVMVSISSEMQQINFFIPGFWCCAAAGPVFMCCPGVVWVSLFAGFALVLICCMWCAVLGFSLWALLPSLSLGAEVLRSPGLQLVIC